MYKVGILSRSGKGLSVVRTELAKHAYYKIQTYTDAPNAVSALKNQSVDGMVVVLTHFAQRQMKLIEQIRQFHPGLPLIFLANEIDVKAQAQARGISGIIALHLDSDVNDVGGLLLRMIQGQKVQNRTKKRRRTVQIASIESQKDAQRDQACLLDLASRGARMRSFKEIYNVGDRLRVEVPLSYLRKTYTIDAEVVWKKRELRSESHPTDSWLAGIKFLSEF